MWSFNESMDFTLGGAAKSRGDYLKVDSVVLQSTTRKFLTWGSSEALNRHHAAVHAFRQLGGGGHFTGGARFSGLHHGWGWESGVHRTQRDWEALTWSAGTTGIVRRDLDFWRRRVKDWRRQKCGKRLTGTLSMVLLNQIKSERWEMTRWSSDWIHILNRGTVFILKSSYAYRCVRDQSKHWHMSS